MVDYIQKTGFLLFSKTKCHKTAKYRLYFVHLPTIYTQAPRIHRLVTRSRKVWEHLTVGDVYDVTYSRITLKTFSYTDTFPLSDVEYESLIDLRDYLFFDGGSFEELGLSDEMPFTSKYFSLSDMRQILSYDPPRAERVLIWLINLLASAAAVVIPAALYVLFVYLYAGSLDFVTEGASPFLALPLVLVLSLPFMVFLMDALFTVGRALLYKLNYTKWTLIRRHILKYGGMKPPFAITRRKRNSLIQFGVISAVIFVASIVLGKLLF